MNKIRVLCLLLLLPVLLISPFTITKADENKDGIVSYTSMSEVLQIDISQKYAEKEKDIISIDKIRSVFKYINVPKAGIPEDGYLGKLNINIDGKAISAIYNPVGLSFTGAEIKGTIKLELADGRQYSGNFTGKKTPPSVIKYVGSNPWNLPTKAPFAQITEQAFYEELGSMFFNVFSIDVLISILNDNSNLARTKSSILANSAIALGGIGPEAAEAVPALIKHLGNTSYYYHEKVIEALGKIGPEAIEAVPALINLLTHKNALLREKVAKTLALIGQGAVPALIDTLTNENNYVRENTADALGMIGPEAVAAVPALTRALEDNSYAVRMKAAEALYNINPEAANTIPALIYLLRNETEFLRDKAAEGLVEFGVRTVPTLIEVINDEKSNEIKEKAVFILGEIGPAAVEAVPVLKNILIDNLSKRLNDAAIISLGKIGPEAVEAVPALIKVLRNKNNFVNKEVVITLGKIGPKAIEAVPVLIALLEKESFDVRKIAAETLGKIGPEAVEAVPALTNALEDKVDIVREKAVIALGMIGPEAVEALPALINLLECDNPYIHKLVIETFIKIGSEALPALIDILIDKNKDIKIRHEAAVALGKIGPDANMAVPTLIGALEDNDTWLKWKAEEALQKITGKEFGDNPELWKQWLKEENISFK